ncbi:hypothetical protein, partial [Photobacterium halotolerans]|uniref:hypothetical protein n=1 Tax=Photobacterium halotolerans TaxID=265726 RepID=UPI000568A9A3
MTVEAIESFDIVVSQTTDLILSSAFSKTLAGYVWVINFKAHYCPDYSTLSGVEGPHQMGFFGLSFGPFGTLYLHGFTGKGYHRFIEADDGQMVVTFIERGLLVGKTELAG